MLHSSSKLSRSWWHPSHSMIEILSALINHHSSNVCSHSKTTIDASYPKTREEGSRTHEEASTHKNLQSLSLDLSPHDIISEISINTSTIYLSPNVKTSSQMHLFTNCFSVTLLHRLDSDWIDYLRNGWRILPFTSHRTG
jgi:hypothetical protein